MSTVGESFVIDREGLERELERLSREKGVKRIAIQAPEGIKREALELSRELRERGFEAWLWMEPCYGACDIPDDVLEARGFEAIVHLGHERMVPPEKERIPVVYVRVYHEEGIGDRLEKIVDSLSGRVGVLATAQHAHQVEEAKKLLEEKGRKVYTARPSWSELEGVVLGCEQSAARAIADSVDCFLLLSTGRFHGLGVARATGKRVVVLDPITGNYEIIEPDKDQEKKRLLLMARLEEAERVGIMVSVKKGQYPLGALAERVARELEERGKRVFFLLFDRISPEKVLGMGLDFLVNGACPRLVEDRGYEVPMANLGDVVEFLGIK